MKATDAHCRINTFWNDLRVANGIKIKDLSEYLGINKCSVSNYITGKQAMPTNVIVKLAEFFDIPIEKANEEAARLNDIHFSGDGRSRSIKKMEGEIETDKKETKEEEKNDISYNNNKEVETYFFYIIDALTNWSDEVLIANADEQIKTLRAHKEALKFYIGKQKPDSQECLNAQHLILKIDILINKIKNTVKKIENKEEKAKCTIEYSEPNKPCIMDIIEKDASSDDIAELILNTVYGKVTREEYEKIKNYLRR